jgi:hypothetical protein
MNTDNKMQFILVGLAFCAAFIYFLAAYQDAEELTNPDSNLQELFAVQVEITLFLIVGFGYIGMSIWILKAKTNLFIPYLIIMVGSVLLIGIYLLAITKGVPIVGVERESDVLATISKIVQGSIISIASILISSVGAANKTIPKIMKRHSISCVLCGRQIIDKRPSITLRMPDGIDHVFDSDICMKYFQKLSGVYGNSLT